MRYEHISKSDLNLLASFQALIEERSVTRAARRMFLSQPAMSRVMDRLQNMFRDELLVRTAKGYEPTHRALSLYAEFERLLPRIEELLRGDEFHPAEATDTFRIAATDHAAVVLLPGLMQALTRKAPRTTVEISAWNADVFHRLENNALDLAFWVNEAPTPLRSEPLFRERFVCLMRRDHPFGGRSLTLKRYLEQKHAVISLSGGRQGLVEQALDRLGRQRNAQLTVPYFSSVGSIVGRTDMIATLPRRLAVRLAAVSNTRFVSAPAEFEGFTYIQVWHPRYDTDPAHRWLRNLVRKTSA